MRFKQRIATTRMHLADTTTQSLLAGTIFVATFFIVTLFLREIPLRKRE